MSLARDTAARQRVDSKLVSEVLHTAPWVHLQGTGLFRGSMAACAQSLWEELQSPGPGLGGGRGRLGGVPLPPGQQTLCPAPPLLSGLVHPLQTSPPSRTASSCSHILSL